MVRFKWGGWLRLGRFDWRLIMAGLAANTGLGMAMRTVELFAGIGGFRIAADRLGMRTVWANEIEARAVKVYSDRFGLEAFHPGDIWEKLEDVPAHDLLTAGFPCQPFSSAGKKRGVEDPRGTLFQAICDILVRRKPKYFLLENVKRLLSMEKGRHFATILHALNQAGYDVEWRLLNAQDFGLPQNRLRVVMAGRRSDDELRVRLLGREEIEKMPDRVVGEIANDSQWEDLESVSEGFPTWGIAKKSRWAGALVGRLESGAECPRFRDLLDSDVPSEYFMTESTIARLPGSDKVDKFVHGVEILYNQAGGARMGYTVFGVNGVAPALTCTTSRHYERYRIGDEYRRLTPWEYARLQGFPDNHCGVVSPYNQYSLYGNAVPPPLAEWAMSKVVGSGVKFPKIKEAQGYLEL